MMLTRSTDKLSHAIVTWIGTANQGRPDKNENPPLFTDERKAEIEATGRLKAIR